MTQKKQYRVLAIAPSARGFGFAVLEDHEALIDWGFKAVKGTSKNAQCLEKIEALIDHYHPERMVLENHDAKDSRRAKRIRELGRDILALATQSRVKVTLFSRQQVRKAVLPNGRGTKREVAIMLSKQFSEELGSRLPPNRKPWMSEDPRMDIFDAVALVLVHWIKKRKRHSQDNRR